MAIFISYSHGDSEFVDRLALRLSEERIHVWLDRWELRVGDSLTQRIEAALERASAILVVLSPASVASDWCRREFTAGLVRELEEKRVIVLPLFIQDCEIPLFLRDKLRADFRGDFEHGLSEVLTALSPLINPHRGRLAEPEFIIDYAVDYFEVEAGNFQRRLTLVEHGPHVPFIAITELLVTGDQQAAAFHKDYADMGLGWWTDVVIVELLASKIDPKLKVSLDDHLAKSLRYHFHDSKLNASYEVVITSRLLGNDTGGGALLHVGNQLRKVFDDQRKATRALTDIETAKVAALRSKRGA